MAEPEAAVDSLRECQASKEREPYGTREVAVDRLELVADGRMEGLDRLQFRGRAGEGGLDSVLQRPSVGVAARPRDVSDDRYGSFRKLHGISIELILGEYKV